MMPVMHTPWVIRGGVLIIALLSYLGLPPAASADDPLIGRVDHVADGDTLSVTVDQTRYRIRLHEIDTPEHDQPWSRQARQALSTKVAGKYVRVEVETVDDYGRTVGKVWLGDRDINREMVRRDGPGRSCLGLPEIPGRPVAARGRSRRAAGEPGPVESRWSSSPVAVAAFESFDADRASR